MHGELGYWGIEALECWGIAGTSAELAVFSRAREYWKWLFLIRLVSRLSGHVAWVGDSQAGNPGLLNPTAP
jgi:hypothetical protein